MIVLAFLAPLFESNLRVSICPFLGATDAVQPWEICRVSMQARSQVAFYDRCEGPGEHVSLQLPAVASDVDVYKASIDELTVVQLA